MSYRKFLPNVLGADFEIRETYPTAPAAVDHSPLVEADVQRVGLYMLALAPNTIFFRAAQTPGLWTATDLKAEWPGVHFYFSRDGNLPQLAWYGQGRGGAAQAYVLEVFYRPKGK